MLTNARAHSGAFRNKNVDFGLHFSRQAAIDMDHCALRRPVILVCALRSLGDDQRPEHLPGQSAPTSAIYEQMNIFHSPTG